MNERLVINTELCNGCGICELVCALSRTGQWHPSLSRIKVLKEEKRKLFLPVVCAHCINPPCVTACLMNVIKKDPETGLTVRDESSCIGCRACEIACPFNACLFDYIEEVVVNCDLCNGDPVCVKYCPTKALQFVPLTEATEMRREDTAKIRIIEAV